MKALILAMLTFMSYAEECTNNRHDYFCIPPDKILNREIDYNTFISMPYSIIKLYEKKLENLSDDFVLNANWNSPYFGAGISSYQSKYHLMILGGTARAKEFTRDAYAAIICHELGHLVGGEPRQTIEGSEWASAEGQADFFAASECLPKYFNSIGIQDKEEVLKKIEKAGFDFLVLAKSANTIKNEELVRVKKKLLKVNSTIINQYPSLQCRYETFRNPNIRANCWYNKKENL